MTPQHPSAKKTIYQHKLSYFFLAFVIIGTLCIALKDITYKKINRPVWTAAVIIAVLMVIITRKVKDGIGVTLESRIITIDILLIFPLLQFGSYNPVLDTIDHYLQLLSLFLWGLMPLYLTLYNIYQCEGTLNRKRLTQFQHRQSMRVIKYNPKVVAQSSPTDPDTKTDIGAKPNDVQTTNNDVHTADVIITPSSATQQIDVKQTFTSFIDDQSNYTIFAKYLAYCFAVENLLFLQQVCIFMELVREYQAQCVNEEDEEEDPDLEENEEQDEELDVRIADELRQQSTNSVGVEQNGDDANQRRLPLTNALSLSISQSIQMQQGSPNNFIRIKFAFLESVYDEFRGIVLAECNKNESEQQTEATQISRNCEYYKPGLDALLTQIVNEFIMEEAPNQVNVASESRMGIISMMRRLEKLVTFQDYLQFFHDALMDVIHLNVSLYKYRFKAYLKAQNML